jgi:hypothetical protein
VDSVEQHRELRGLHLDVIAARVDHGQLESALLQALQLEDEAGTVPEEDLHLVLRLADEQYPLHEPAFFRGPDRERMLAG